MLGNRPAIVLHAAQKRHLNEARTRSTVILSTVCHLLARDDDRLLEHTPRDDFVASRRRQTAIVPVCEMLRFFENRLFY